MRILAIETATEICSVALFDGMQYLANDHRALGRGHAEQLVPMISTLPNKGMADRIIVSLGPGSFTGVRVGIAAARSLGIAWNVPVLGYPTMMLIAAMAQETMQQPVTVCMNGGHGEWFLQNFGADATSQDKVRSLTPERARAECRHPFIAGNRAHELAALFDDDGRQAVEVLPDARATSILSPACFADNLAPIYGRGPDAKLPAS